MIIGVYPNPRNIHSLCVDEINTEDVNRFLGENGEIFVSVAFFFRIGYIVFYRFFSLMSSDISKKSSGWKELLSR